MEAYIEIVAINNFVINCLIFFLTLTCLKLRIVWWKILLASAIGTIFAITYPSYVDSVPEIGNFAFKLSVGALLCLIYVCKSVKKYFSFFFVFLFNTFLLGGLCYGVNYMFSKSFNLDFQFSTGFVLGVALIYYFLVKKLCVIFYSRKQISNFRYEVKLTINGITRQIEAYLDSGNLLKKDCVPISIMSFKELEKFKTDVNIISLLERKKSKILNCCEFVPFSTVGQGGYVLVFKPDKFEIEISNKLKFNSETYIGVIAKNIFKSNVGLLLNGGLL